jgi:hypothetical protein
MDVLIIAVLDEGLHFRHEKMKKLVCVLIWDNGFVVIRNKVDENSRFRKEYLDLIDDSSQTSVAPPPIASTIKFDKHSPDGSWKHLWSKFAGVLLEIAHSQKIKMMGKLLYDYLVGSHGRVRLVIVIKIGHSPAANQDPNALDKVCSVVTYEAKIVNGQHDYVVRDEEEVCASFRTRTRGRLTKYRYSEMLTANALMETEKSESASKTFLIQNFVLISLMTFSTTKRG